MKDEKCGSEIYVPGKPDDAPEGALFQPTSNLKHFTDVATVTCPGN